MKVRFDDVITTVCHIGSKKLLSTHLKLKLSRETNFKFRFSSISMKFNMIKLDCEGIDCTFSNVWSFEDLFHRELQTVIL